MNDEKKILSKQKGSFKQQQKRGYLSFGMRRFLRSNVSRLKVKDKDLQNLVTIIFLAFLLSIGSMAASLAAPQSGSFAKGKLTKVTSSVSETQYKLFDNMGRLTESSQITDGQTYTSKYTYNLSGALVEEEYPSGRKVKNEFESDGDLLNVTSKKSGGSVFTPYVSNFSYTASGGISQMRLGNGRWETAKFNNRMQLTELGLGSSATDASIWKVNYDYGELQANGTVDVAKNTGNIAKQTLSFTGLTNPLVQAYKYDSLYRLTEAKETANGNQNWIQQFGYDRYGNRTGFNQEMGGLTNNQTPTVDGNTNRFVTTGTNFHYDLNGNLIRDAEGRQFIFNGDNKQTIVKDINDNVIGRYFYDGDGKRVKKITNTETTVFVYSSGKLIAEYSTQLSQTPSINYTTTDHLGSPRVITDASGQVKSRRDFMPFGEDLYMGVGGRSEILKYGSNQDDIKQKFTGYLKDNETGLDFAEARMYENRHARFTAVDPLLASGKSANPQSFNRYSYVGNRPLTLTDPTGLDWYFQTIEGRTRYRWSSDNKAFDDGDKSSVEGWGAVEFGFGGQHQYQGCVDSECSSQRGAVLYQGGGWDWIGSFSYAMRSEWRRAYQDISREIGNGFPETKKDIEKIVNDPLGPYGLGNPHLGMATGGAVSGFQGFSRIPSIFTRSLGAVDDAAETTSAVSKVVQFEQYTLRAARDGMFPVMQRGFKEPVGEVFLKKGDVWKFGETMNPSTRYSGSFLTNTGNGLRFFPEFKTPSFKEAFQIQKQKIIDYEVRFGKLPPGNKIRG